MHALVIIDLQTWMFRLPERQDQIKRLVSRIGQVITAFEAAECPIYDVRTVHKADQSTWTRLMLKYDYPCLLEGTPDAEPIEGYCPPHGATEIIKTAHSAFVETNFDQVLQNDRITHLFLAGVFIDGCVGLTAADAAQRGYEVTFIDDAIGHTNANLRAPVFQWLVDAFEMQTLNSISIENVVEERGKIT